MKEDKYTKSLAKNQVYAIVHMRDIRKNVLPKFIKLCMETPCLCPFQGHKYGRGKPTETHTVRGRLTPKKEIRRFRNGLVRERKVNERKLLRQSKTLK